MNKPFVEGLLLSALAFGCAKAAPETTALGLPRPAVRTARVELSPEAPLRATGRVWAASRRQLGFSAGGVVGRVLVDTGDKVRAGQLVAVLDNGEARARVGAARAGERRAVREWRDMTHPRAEGLFTEHDRVQTQTSREVAEAELAYAEAVLARRVLRAPVDGTVFKRLVTEGEVVDPGRTLFIVDETSTLIVDCALIASEISRVSRGDEVWVTANEQRLAGRVAWVSDAPENDGALYTLRVRLDASALGLPLGLLVSVEFPSSATGQAIHVGLPALLNRNDHDYVFVVAEMGSESVAALRQVELGRAAGQATRVLKGLSPGERIIAEGGYFISDGQPVSITQ